MDANPSLVLGVIINTVGCGDLTHLKLTVADDKRRPVADALVRMGFFDDNPNTNHAPQRTNAEGSVSAVGVQRWGVRINVTKDGFYRSERRVNIDYGDIKITLRPIKTPVPMYCKKVQLPFPRRDIAMDFDFEKTDWVAPHGKGITAHMNVVFDGVQTDVWNSWSKTNLTFANKYDGVAKLKKPSPFSKFTWPYLAPTDGYINSLFYHNWSEKKEGSSSKYHKDYDDFLLGMAFRINTEVDGEGNVISANYGRIQGDIYTTSRYSEFVKGSQSGYMEISICYNPIPNQRSLEISRNLYKDENIRGRSKNR